MTDIDISNGNTAQIISPEQAAKVLSEEHPASGFIIYTDGDIRLAHEDAKDVAQAALPIKQGTYITNLDPKGESMYAFNDESTGSVTVSVQLQKFTVHEVA